MTIQNWKHIRNKGSLGTLFYLSLDYFMKIIYSIFFLLVINSCNEEKRNIKYFIIPPVTEIHAHQPPRPAIEKYYGADNFILFNDTTIYHFESDSGRMCGNGINKDMLPKKLGLKPELLTRIDTSELKNHLTKMPMRRFISVSSPSDTIRNEGFWIIKDAIERKNLNRFIRKCTEEEYFVAMAKFYNRQYEPEKIKWKIGFDSTNTN
jgi:hypothetical protein